MEQEYTNMIESGLKGKNGWIELHLYIGSLKLWEGDFKENPIKRKIEILSDIQRILNSYKKEECKKLSAAITEYINTHESFVL